MKKILFVFVLASLVLSNCGAERVQYDLSKPIHIKVDWESFEGSGWNKNMIVDTIMVWPDYVSEIQFDFWSGDREIVIEYDPSLDDKNHYHYLEGRIVIGPPGNCMKSLYYAIPHEIGHAFGLKHSDDDNSVMRSHDTNCWSHFGDADYEIVFPSEEDVSNVYALHPEIAP